MASLALRSHERGCQWRDDSAGTLERATELLFWETGTTLEYSHTNDRCQLGHSGAPAALPQIRHRHAPLAVCTETSHATGVPGVGDGMEPNRPVACFVKCHVDGRR
jgi:hypothetical protein